MLRAAFFIFVSFVAIPAVAEPDTEKIAPHCKISPADMGSFEGGFCFGSVFSIIDFGDQVGVCPPADYTIPKALEIVTAYAQQHPRQSENAFGLTAYAALSSAWPCPKK